MNEHKAHLDEIAQAAAALYGQDWSKLPQWSKDRWREVVSHAAPSSTYSSTPPVNQMERCAVVAIDHWYKKQEEAANVTPEAAPVAETEAVEATEAPPKQKSKKK